MAEIGLTEDQVRERLYGLPERSGLVSVVDPLDPETWTWDWPKSPRVSGNRWYVEFPPVTVRTGESFSMRVEYGPFGLTVKT